MTSQLQILAQEVSRLADDNRRLREATEGGIGAIPALVQAVTKLSTTRSDSNRLVDNKGIGKPTSFDGQEQKYREWSSKFEAFVVSVFGEVFRRVLEWAVERQDPIDKTAWTDAFGKDSDDDEVDGIDDMVAQLHMALQQLTTGEPFDLTQNVEKGNGLECWRKLARRYDPSTGGRKRNLLKQVLSPGRCKLEELAGAMERWEEAVSRYGRRKDDDGNREYLSDSVKMAALESLLPVELEEHIMMNQSRLGSYELIRREVAAYLEARTGARIREVPVLNRQQRDPNAMDIGSLTRKGKGKEGKGKGKEKKGGMGKGKGDKSNLLCWNCGRLGHMKPDCWRPAAPQEVIAEAKKKAKSKGGGGKGGKGGKPQAGGALSIGSCEADTGGAGGTGGDQVEDQAFLELFALPAAQSNQKAIDEDGWMKLNFDSGCASSVVPREWVKAISPPSGRKFKTANGVIIADEGLGVLEGISENGEAMRFAGRRAAVGKPLASASELLKSRIGLMDDSAGMVIEKKSEAGRAIMKLMSELKEKGRLEDNMRLHQERGVYNVYMKLPAAKAKELEAIPAHAFHDAGQEEQPGGHFGPPTGASSSGSLSGGTRPACP